MIRGHKLQELVDAGLAPSVKWLQHQIRAGKITARKIGRHWVMTDADIDEALEKWRNRPLPPSPKVAGTVALFSLTPTSLRRHRRR